jgi:uncharacterized protein YbjT (DUF2867 family)
LAPRRLGRELNVVASAARAGVGHVVKITSKASADSPIARRRDQTEIENGLIASGLGCTLLRNNAYMQNFVDGPHLLRAQRDRPRLPVVTQVRERGRPRDRQGLRRSLQLPGQRDQPDTHTVRRRDRGQHLGGPRGERAVRGRHRVPRGEDDLVFPGCG